MTDIGTEIVPLALGIAASPFGVVPAILLLFTARPRVTASAFLLGWAGGILLATTAFELLSAFITAHDEPPSWASWTRIAIGAALAVLGVLRWFRRDPDGEAPGWMQSISQQNPVGAARLGFVLAAANPKVLLLAAGGGLAIGSAELPTEQVVASVLLFTAVAAVTVLLPVLLHLALGDRVLAPLAQVRDCLLANSSAVMSVVITVLGLLLISKGFSGLK